MSFSPWATQSKNSVGEDWSCGHGCTATWMIIVQRGMKSHACVCISNDNFHSCYLMLSVLPSLGGCWALLSEVPAAGHRGPSVCCGQRKPWQGAGLLQKVLLWEGVCGSEGLLLRNSPPTHGFKLRNSVEHGRLCNLKSCFYINLTEKFLRPSREVDVSLHVPAYRRVEEPLAGLPEGLQGKPERWRTCPGGSLCHWTCRSGRQYLTE